MKILKHGNMMPRFFVCKFCRCEFVADRNEYGVAASGDNFFVKCPDCGGNFDMHAPLYEENNDTFVIVDTTEDTGYEKWVHSMYCDWMEKQGM